MLNGFLFKILFHFLKNLEYLLICHPHSSVDQAHGEVIMVVAAICQRTQSKLSYFLCCASSRFDIYTYTFYTHQKPTGRLLQMQEKYLLPFKSYLKYLTDYYSMLTSDTVHTHLSHWN